MKWTSHMLFDEEYDFSKDAAALYESYLSTVQVLLVDYEIITGEFLTQALNEIRSAFTHIARASRVCAKDTDSARDNMTKAERHIKRAILDCYKALCVAYFTKQKKFESDYAGVDLRLANNGNFLPRLQTLKLAARNTYANARYAECEGVKCSENEIFSLYEKAYICHKELDDFRTNSIKDVEFAKNATAKNRKLTELSLCLGVFSAVMTVISIVLAIVLIL